MNSSNVERTSLCFQVAAFYCFTSLNENTIIQLTDSLKLIGITNGLKGTVLLANEGINGTICGLTNSIDLFLEALVSSGLDITSNLKLSWTNEQAFRRLKVRRKKEIVTIGLPEVKPSRIVGNYVEAEDWNDFLSDDKTLVIDTRNSYEIAIGSFEGSLNPNTHSFSEFPQWVETELTSIVSEKSPKRIAMFCTGGIRCEKATSLLVERGFKGVHHLHGGILKYLEKVPISNSFWKGECFVFDQRVALNHNLETGEHKLCYACGLPLSINDREKLAYIPGVQCEHCINQFSEEDKIRFYDRHVQMSRDN